MLAAANRLRSSTEFSRTTKIGHRASSSTLVLYFLHRADLPEVPQLGLIINKSVGGSVTRHRIARQLRHCAKPLLSQFPTHTQLVLRVLKDVPRYDEDLGAVATKALERLGVLK